MSRVDAEIAVLGACLIDPQAFWRVADILEADDFANERNRDVWETIAALSRKGMTPDDVTVAAALKSVSSRELQDIMHNTSSAANARGYAGWVQAAAVERRVNAAGHRIAKLKGEDVIGEAQRILGTCQPRSSSAVRSIRDFLQQSTVAMQDRCDATDPLTGVPTSLDWLDEQTSGWQRGDLIILAARPSVGKTAFAIQCALHAAGQGQPVFFASLEQSGQQIAERALAHVGHIPLARIMQPKSMEEGDWPRVIDASAQIKAMPMLIDETGALTVDAICARCRQANAEKRLGLIVIDYLTQIKPPKANSTTDAIQEITRTLKALAKELAVPMILLSQLSREGSARPDLTHLRSSGAIEQDADVVLFLHRPDDNNRDLVQLTIAKQRNGPVGEAYLHAAMEHMRFTITQERPAPSAPTRSKGLR